MSKKATIIAVVNQKGGTGKTTTTENLGVGLALEGKKVLLVDTDPQASLTVSLGNPCPDDLSPTLSDLMGKIMMENPITPDEGILHHPEGVDLVPSNIELSGMEVALVNAMSRETILRQYLDSGLRKLYRCCVRHDRGTGGSERTGRYHECVAGKAVHVSAGCADRL